MYKTRIYVLLYVYSCYTWSRCVFCVLKFSWVNMPQEFMTSLFGRHIYSTRILWTTATSLDGAWSQISPFNGSFLVFPDCCSHSVKSLEKRSIGIFSEWRTWIIIQPRMFPVVTNLSLTFADSFVKVVGVIYSKSFSSASALSWGNFLSMTL